MSNASSIMAASYLDQLCNKSIGGGVVGAISADMLEGSLHNPLQAMRLLSINVDQGLSYDSEALAQVTGLPVEWLNDQYLNAPMEDILKALGRLALVYLSSLRNAALAHSFKVAAREDCLQAESTLAEVLTMNGKLGGRTAH